MQNTTNDYYLRTRFRFLLDFRTRHFPC